MRIPSLLVAMLVFGMIAGGAIEAETSTHIYMNGISIDAVVLICNGVTYVPLRVIAEELSYSVQWRPTEGVFIKNYGHPSKNSSAATTEVATQQVRQRQAIGIYVNGKPIQAEPLMQNSVTYVPLRAVADALQISTKYCDGKIYLSTMGNTTTAILLSSSSSKVDQDMRNSVAGGSRGNEFQEDIPQQASVVQDATTEWPDWAGQPGRVYSGSEAVFFPAAPPEIQPFSTPDGKIWPLVDKTPDGRPGLITYPEGSYSMVFVGKPPNIEWRWLFNAANYVREYRIDTTAMRAIVVNVEPPPAILQGDAAIRFVANEYIEREINAGAMTSGSLRTIYRSGPGSPIRPFVAEGTVAVACDVEAVTKGGFLRKVTIYLFMNQTGIQERNAYISNGKKVIVRGGWNVITVIYPGISSKGIW